MNLLRWSMQSEGKFTLVWTLIQTFGGAAIIAIAFAVQTRFPIEALFVGGSMPFAGLLSAPIMWRALMARREALKRRKDAVEGD